jgi:lipopolysaccharide biosynthesis glycosyltransferase
MSSSSKPYDQDVLNAIVKDWLPLSPRWNFPSDAFETEIEKMLAPVLYHNLSKAWDFGQANRRELALFRKAIGETPFSDFALRPQFKQVQRFVEKRVKQLVQRATFFLPSSRRRLQARNIQGTLARHIIRGVKASRFADVEQGLSTIDIPALSLLDRSRT